MASGRTKPFHLVVAATLNRGIGYKGRLPWRLPKEMEHFKRLTLQTQDDALQNAVIMGRKTFESIPDKFRPLAGRINLVLTRQKENCQSIPSGVYVCESMDESFSVIDGLAKVDIVYVIGGAQIYEEAIKHPRCKSIYYTLIKSPTFELDTYFPEIDSKTFKLDPSYPEAGQEHEENGVRYEFLRYIRDESLAAVPSTASTSSSSSSVCSAAPHEEEQYLRLVKEIIETGIERGDRTGVGTLSKFGCQMRFSLRDNQFPLLTTKRVWWKGIVEELLWFVSGCTDADVLAAKKVNIWKENGSKEFLTKIGLGHREEGDLGPVYGFQWRHWGAKYIDKHADYNGQGIDQLAECVRLIKEDPESRRIVLNAWNPSDLKLMALPPCHMFCQFYIDRARSELSCQMYQRSADMGLGVPFNIASYSLLTRILAHVCGLKPGEFVHTLGDAHVYKNHVEGLNEQIKRTPKPFPILKIRDRGQGIDDFVFEDFELEHYEHHPAISLPFAV